MNWNDQFLGVVGPNEDPYCVGYFATWEGGFEARNQCPYPRRSEAARGWRAGARDGFVDACAAKEGARISPDDLQLLV